jgi:hypothetical protein
MDCNTTKHVLRGLEHNCTMFCTCTHRLLLYYMYRIHAIISLIQIFNLCSDTLSLGTAARPTTKRIDIKSSMSVPDRFQFEPGTLGAVHGPHPQSEGEDGEHSQLQRAQPGQAPLRVRPQSTYIQRGPHCMSPRRIWDSPNPLFRQRVCPSPPRTKGEEHTRMRVRGWGSPNSDDLRKA